MLHVVGTMYVDAIYDMRCCIFIFFFFNDPATTEIYTLSLHDALPICFVGRSVRVCLYVNVYMCVGMSVYVCVSMYECV